MLQPDVKTVVLTRDAAGNAAWAAQLESLGFHVYSLPTIETVPLGLTDAQKDIVKRLPDYDWLVFTSPKCVQYFSGILFQLGVKWPPDKPSVVAIGTQTAKFIEERGLRVNFKPTQANSEALGRELTPISGMRILLPRTDIASNVLTTLLTKRGGDVTPLPIYSTRLVDTPDKTFLNKLAAPSIDVLIFASPSAVRGFSIQIGDPDLLRKAKSLPTIANGQSTATALHEAGFTHVTTCPTPSLESIIELLQ